jgi:tRNA-Thr(GGU) m(6)t(6)A37 methyltransferase TsaA
MSARQTSSSSSRQGGSLATSTSNANNSSYHQLLLLLSSTIVVSVTTALLVSCRHRQHIKRLQQEWHQRRQEERTGRIRAEIKLRTLVKEQQQQQQQQQQQLLLPVMDRKENTAQYDPAAAARTRTMLLSCIGTVTSPFTKRMGTPRQPALVPASRGYIEFCTEASAALDGIEHYSHLWIIFEFHANTNNTSSSAENKKTKIRPPRAGGIKIGQLATRSPHRPNCLGLSLVRIDQWDCKTKRLHISGIDLVHGTPVYDVKPFVPCDVPAPLQQQQLHLENHDNGNYTGFKVPDWVSQQDSLSRVDFTPTALDALCTLVLQKRRLAPLYTDDNDGLAAAKATLEQILAQDPRSSHKGLKTNARGTTTTTTTSSSDAAAAAPLAYSLVFCQVQVDFVVDYDASLVQVVKCSEIDFDDAAYVDGVPLISEQNNNDNKK